MSEVLVEHEDGLVIITINRPEAKNAVNRAVSYGVCAAVDELDARDDLRVGILTGAGGTFCSGMDLKAFLRGEVTRVEGRGILGIAMTPPKKPLIAAVEGYALAPETYSKDGLCTYSRDVPATVLATGTVKIDFALDHFLAAGEIETRELGIIFRRVALEPK